MTTLERLARSWGVMPSFRPDEGDEASEPVRASPEALVHVLRVLGAPITGPDDAAAALRTREAEVWSRCVEPSAAVTSRRTAGSGAARPSRSPSTLDLRIPSASRDEPLELLVETERGELLEGRLTPADGRVLEEREVEGTDRALIRVEIPFEVPPGVHRAVVRSGGVSGTAGGAAGGSAGGEAAGTAGGRSEPREDVCTLIAAPEHAFTRAERGWGLFLPLYALRHAADGGVGDYPALGRLLRWTAERGGEAVGTLPLLPTSLDEPFDPGPYQPLSRLFWSEAYVDPGSFAGGGPPTGSGAARAARSDRVPADLRERLERLRAAPRVDWREAWAVRRRLLEDAAAAFFDSGGEDDPDFRAFLGRRPEVERWARFRAVMDARREPWTRWPAALTGGEIPDAEAPEAGVRFHRWAQWVAEAQLDMAATTGVGGGRADGGRAGGGPGAAGRGSGEVEPGAGLYLDLPLGTAAHGYDVWRHRSLFAEGASGGAPPDLFHEGGQDWGFPPLHPHRIREEGFGHLREVLRHHMRHARLLRIDHVMSLHRLYWVPDGLGAREGVYVRYPAEELHALVRLESHRNRCEVVGEDLGTVPAEVREAMDRDRMRKMWVLPFEFDEREGEPGDGDSGATLRPPSPNSLAALNTHDLPTFAGYWEGVDLEEAAAAGHLDEEEARGERARRETLRGVLEREVAPRTDVTEPDPTEREAPLSTASADDADLHALLRRTLRLLSDSAARIVVVSLEDLWLETVPQNRPAGPPEENWRGRAKHRLEELDGLEEVEGAVEALERV